MAKPETMPTPLTAGERRWGLAASIASVAVFGVSIGEAGPLMSLLLEKRGTDPALIGLNAASTFLGVIAGPLLTPFWVRRVGVRNFLLLCFGLDVAVFLLMHVFDSLPSWFVLRALLGAIGSSIFTSSEAWISSLAGDVMRGRVIGLYAAALSAGFGIGPLLLWTTGIEGWPPFIANGVITAIAALPLLGAGKLGGGLGKERGASPLVMFARAPLIVVAVALFGIYETSLLTLLPVWAVRTGLGASLAAATLSAVYVGSIALQVPIGWLSDKVARRSVLRMCGAVGLVGALLLATTTVSVPGLFCLLFVWGGIVGGIYPVALGMAGDRFQGGDLVAVNAAVIIAYGLGSLLGPALGGVAMDVWNPRGLLGLLALVFALFLGFTSLGGGPRSGRLKSVVQRVP